MSCVDINEPRIEALKTGVVPFFEPGLSEVVTKNAAAGRLELTTDPRTAVEDADLVFIAVGTPPDDDGSADLKYVLRVAETIGTYLQGYIVIVDKSTVPVETAE